jgi:phenylpropionate dioxygenase-like ring-hydroxylating dioxygenase large terminal subunit
MLSKEDNDLLNHVGPGTPANTVFKHVWLPFLFSEELIADGMPEKVELLGEKYIAFRDSSGNVGFMDEACPHRGISLSLARNENNGLTCIFHGWTFNARGECVATPTEPNKDFCRKVRVRAYPTHEAGGVIFVYLAPGKPTRFPDYGYSYAKPENIHVRRALANANWSQILEAFFDPAHVPFLHRNDLMRVASGSLAGLAAMAPTLAVAPTDYGFRLFARRERSDGTSHVRVTEYVSPLTGWAPTSDDEIKFFTVTVPVNDTKSLFWIFNHGTPEQIADGGQLRFLTDPHDYARDLDRSSPNLGQDREAMRQGSWSGFDELPVEDVAVCESMPVFDRTKEFLGSADMPVVRVRHEVLKHLRAARDGNWQGFSDGSGFHYRQIQGDSIIIPTDQDMIAHVQNLYEQRIASFNKSSRAAE